MTTLGDAVFSVHDGFKSAVASRLFRGASPMGIAGSRCATFSTATGNAGVRAVFACRSRAVC
jgi:hypothetical protein